MTQAERNAIDVLTDHVMELKQDMGEVKADLRSLKEDRDAARGERVHWRNILSNVLAAFLGAASLVGLERAWPGH